MCITKLQCTYDHVTEALKYLYFVKMVYVFMFVFKLSHVLAFLYFHTCYSIMSLCRCWYKSSFWLCVCSRPWRLAFPLTYNFPLLENIACMFSKDAKMFGKFWIQPDQEVCSWKVTLCIILAARFWRMHNGCKELLYVFPQISEQ